MRKFADKSVYGCAISLWALGIVAASSNTVFADGVIRDGLGAISIGRGGTNIAHSDNGQILLDNPAAMVNIEGSGLFELGLDTLLTDLHYSDPQNNVDAAVTPFPLGQMSVLVKSPDDVWAAGIGVFLPAGFGAEWDKTGPPLIPGSQTYKSVGVMGKILPGVAVRLTDRLSVGGTLGVAVSHAALEGPFFLQTGLLAGAPTVIDLDGSGAALAWSLGLQFKLSERTTLGLAFQNETRFQLDGSAVVDVIALGESSRFDATTDLVWPRSVGLGIKHDLCPHRRLSIDVIWFHWSHAFDGLDLQLSNPTNPVVELAVGPTIRDRFPLDWRDSVSLRTGYEHFLTSGYVLRTGYAYHPNQIPEETLTTYIPAILEHAFSIGLGRKFCGHSFDVAYQYSFGQGREVNVSNVLGGDFDSSRIEAQAHWLSISYLHRF